VERLIFALVANRALAPRSKLALEDWVAHEVAVPGLEKVAVQHLYRAMDFLLEAAEELQREVFFSVADLLSLEVDLIYFDATSTYFEVELSSDEGEPLRRYGHSRDHRPDRPQAVIGLAVTRTGIPVRCWVWPGDTADMSVVEEVKRDLVGWKLGRVITVVDRGMASEENLRVLQRTGVHYIAGERMASGKPAVEEALSRQGRYQKVRDNLEVKEVVVGDGEARKRYILVRNLREAERDRARREQTLNELEQELESLKYLPEGSTPRRCARCAAIRPGGGTSSRTERAGSQSTGPRSRPRSVWTASTCSGPRTTR
jgi:transposase